jgi:oligopeptide transport system permease protein
VKKYLFKRLLGIIPLLFILATASFFIMRIAPGGPFDTERVLPEEVQKNLAAKYHLDEPLAKQYLRYMTDLLRGDLGPSFKYADRSVNEIIGGSLPFSLTLGGFALCLAVSFGIPLGILASVKRNSFWDWSGIGISLIGISIPNFVIGPVFIIIFSIKLGWFNVAGWRSPKDFILPGITLALPYIAYLARLVRAGMLDVMPQDFIRTARAKGVSEIKVIAKHALPHGILPAVSFLGPASAGIITGSVVIETIFNLPGLGRHFVYAALNRDYTLVLGTVLLYSSFLVLFNLIVDLFLAMLDPRIRYEK